MRESRGVAMNLAIEILVHAEYSTPMPGVINDRQLGGHPASAVGSATPRTGKQVSAPSHQEHSDPLSDSPALAPPWARRRAAPGRRHTAPDRGGPTLSYGG